ncbi:hypothetical protein BB561_001767 [Smittium simulii]|uniref:Uncharacterized protein n=1 Tax=Smittium simulii TaxID=133385 RepID=A0A2T9YT60_9FUNG|nr:hypothetical protein BB561_001767 [Smittium simulii]
MLTMPETQVDTSMTELRADESKTFCIEAKKSETFEEFNKLIESFSANAEEKDVPRSVSSLVQVKHKGVKIAEPCVKPSDPCLNGIITKHESAAKHAKKAKSIRSALSIKKSKKSSVSTNDAAKEAEKTIQSTGNDEENIIQVTGKDEENIIQFTSNDAENTIQFTANETENTIQSTANETDKTTQIATNEAEESSHSAEKTKRHDKTKRASLLYMIKLPKSIQTLSATMFSSKKSDTGLDSKKMETEQSNDQVSSQEISAQPSSAPEESPDTKSDTGDQKAEKSGSIVPDTFGSPDLNLNLDAFEPTKEPESSGNVSQPERIIPQKTKSTYNMRDKPKLAEKDNKRKSIAVFTNISSTFWDKQTTTLLSSFNSFYEKMFGPAAQKSSKSKKEKKKSSPNPELDSVPSPQPADQPPKITSDVPAEHTDQPAEIASEASVQHSDPARPETANSAPKEFRIEFHSFDLGLRPKNTL